MCEEVDRCKHFEIGILFVNKILTQVWLLSPKIK